MKITKQVYNDIDIVVYPYVISQFSVTFGGAILVKTNK